MMNRKCMICGSVLSEPLFSADNMPLGAQAMPTGEEIKAGLDHGIRLDLKRCPVCGLTQFDCEPVGYYKKVIRAVGLSKTMQDLRRDDYRHLIDDYGMGGGKWIECGCGNGDFLKVLKEFPVEIYATEADAGNVSVAREQLGLTGDHIMEFFPDRADMDIPGAPFDVFLSFNFLEHQPDPVSMLGCMYRNLRAGGMGLITVPSFEYILQEGRYYELVRDHIANYDLPALTALCKRCGFEVLEQGYIGIGDTLRVVVRKSAGGMGSDGVVHLEKCAEHNGKSRKVSSNDKYLVLGRNYKDISSKIEAYMADLTTGGRSIAMWGASHQGFTIAATTALKDHVRYIIDSAAFKQGRFAPASHLPIVSPEHYLTDPVDVILIAAPGYIREIEASIRERYADSAAGIPAICDVLSFKER